MAHVLPDTREVQSGVRMDKEARRMELQQCMETLMDHHTRLNDTDMYECICAITEGVCDISVVSPVNLISAERGLGRGAAKETLLKTIGISEDGLPDVIMIPVFGPESPSPDAESHMRKIRTTGTADGSGMHWSLVILIRQGNESEELLFDFENEVTSNVPNDPRYSQLLGGVAFETGDTDISEDNSNDEEERVHSVYTGYHYDSLMGTNGSRVQNLRFLFDAMFNPAGSHGTHIVEMEYIIIQKEAWECGHMCLLFVTMFMFNATDTVPWSFAPGHIDAGRNWKLSLPKSVHIKSWKHMIDSIYNGSGGTFVGIMRKLIKLRMSLVS